MAELRLEHIYKTYKGGVEAVKDLNLTVADGEIPDGVRTLSSSTRQVPSVSRTRSQPATWQ